MQAQWKRRRRAAHVVGAPAGGRCPLCAGERLRTIDAVNPREGIVCIDCGSVPRQRALSATLAARGLAAGCVHESSPSLCTFVWLRQAARELVASYYWPDRRPGARVGAFRNVDLRTQPFGETRFDLVVTQDVLEHVPEPRAALREIHRTLRPGGAHVFTVPRSQHRDTVTRAELRDGRMHHHLPPEYHRDPVDRGGALVVTDWGRDLEAAVVATGAATCTAVGVQDPAIGVPRPVEVFVAVTPT